MYKAVFIDVDDTLLNFEICCRAAFGKSFETFHLEYDDKIYLLFKEINDELWRKQKQGLLPIKDVLELRFKELFNASHIKVDPAAFESAFQEHLSNEYALEPGALDIIPFLHSNHSLYVTSNGILTMQRRRLESAGLLPYFSDLFVSDDIGHEKPSADFFTECLRRCQFKNNEVLIIGDSLEADIIGGAGCKVDTCWYNPHNRPNNIDVNVNYMINNLLELKHLGI